jgi:hypothetical protein
MWATKIQATALSIVASKSLARRRHRPSQPRVRSPTHRRGSRTKPWAASERRVHADLLGDVIEHDCGQHLAAPEVAAWISQAAKLESVA